MIPREEELIYRSRWIVRIRWLVALAMGLGVLGFYVLDLPYKTVPLLVLSAAVVGYNILFAVAARWTLMKPVSLKRVYLFVNLQIAVDFLALLAWIHYSGGPLSPFLPFFIFHLIICGLLVSATSTMVHACWVLLALIIMGICETEGLLPHYSPLNSGVTEPIDSYRHLIAVGAVTGAMFLTVAVLVGGIARRLRRREQELDEARRSCEKNSQQIQRAHSQLEKVAAERNTFYRMVSHQLRSPLTSIQSMVRLITSGNVEEREQIRDLLTRADRQAQHMLAMINDLLSLTHLKAMNREEQRERLSVPQLIRDVAERLRSMAEEKEIRVELDIAASIPPVEGIHNRVEQLFSVLIENAIKYTPEEGEVAVSSFLDDGRVVVKVRDSGIGIPAGNTDKIFEEFYRAANARKYTRMGTGLGLSLARTIVEDLNGTIEVDSTPGEGSCFTVKIPAASGTSE